MSLRDDQRQRVPGRRSFRRELRNKIARGRAVGNIYLVVDGGPDGLHHRVAHETENDRDADQRLDAAWEMAEMLQRNGYDPFGGGVAALMRDGIGPEELRERLREPGGLTRTHKVQKGGEMGSDDEDEESEFEEPDEGDWTTEDHRRFYSYGKIVLDLPADTGECKMWAAIEAKMKKDGFWPNVWLISDHGNSHLMTNPGSKVCRPPRKKKGKKKRGAKVHRA